MKKIKKVLLIFISMIIMLAGEGVIKAANADWEEDNSNWKYIDNSGYSSGWQQINNKWYYFNPETKIMTIGWFFDKEYGKWYYLNFNGDMDATKTTLAYPEELSNIQNKIQKYTSEEVSYIYTNKIDDAVFVIFKDDISAREYYYHSGTGNIYEYKNGILTNILTKEVIDFFTRDQAIQLVHDYLSKNNKYIPQIISVENDDGNSYLVHCYDEIGLYTATSSWYYVNKETREITSAL